MNDYEVDANERPIYPPKILSIEVIDNPFPDIVPREQKVEKIEKKVEPQVEKKTIPKAP